ncbi:MAG: hypothetical protein ACREJN_21480 [Nitrospiraceae bacterium]
MKPLNVLVGCEYSGVVRDAFLALGHHATSCDLLPTLKKGPHLKCDVLTVLDFGWDLALFYPPCTYLCSSGLFRLKNDPIRRTRHELALNFVQRLLDAPIPKIALENPVGRISTAIRKPDQIIQPYQFGDDASKATCLWLKNLDPLTKNPNDYYPPRIVNGKFRWSNQTDSGQNRLGPSETRGLDRAKTYLGIAHAKALQWGGLVQH